MNYSAKPWLTALALALTSPLALAGWSLDPAASSLSFVSIKNNTVAEVHHFTQFSGEVSDSGEATLTINLDSVETGIPIRNERMRKLLFDTAKFAQAEVGLQVDMKSLAKLKPGEDLMLQSPISLNLHGLSAELPSDLQVTRLSAHRYRVVTAAPVIVSAGDFALSDGIEALREIAGLKAIGTGVPVSVSLTFTTK